jgi:serine/threonine protein kinase
MVSDTSDWVGATLGEGRYKVHRKLGEGGMAHVYLARDDKLERDVVIKVPRANLIHDPTFAGRFTREIRSLARLAHPHIVPLIDIGQNDGIPFAVMSYLTGGSLRERQPRGPDGEARPMPPNTLGTWLPPAAQALDFVHKQKFIHRDIKPENILFDEDGQPFLADLGIVKALSVPVAESNKRTVVTGAGMVLGTPQYMAPELIMGEAVDGRADQYALAVTVYEVMSGQVPFTGSSAPAIFIQQTTKPPRDLQELVPDIPDALAKAVARALAKSPAERFGSCYEFAQAALVGQSVKFYTPSAGTPATTVEPPRAPTPVVTATLVEPPKLGTRTPVETPSDLEASLRRNTPRDNVSHRDASLPAALAAPAANTWSAGRQPAKKSALPLLLGLGALLSIGAAAAAILLRPQPVAASLAVTASGKLSMSSGEKKTLKIDVERKHLEGEIKCSLEGLPEGVSAEPVVIAADATSGTLTVVAAMSAATSTAKATVKAKCKDTEATTPVEIAVVARTPSIKFRPVEQPVTLKAGEIVSVVLHVERENCQGDVILEFKDLPPGVRRIPDPLYDNIIKEEEKKYELKLRADETAGMSPSDQTARLSVTGALHWAKDTKATPAKDTVAIPLTVIPKAKEPLSNPKDIVIEKIADVSLKVGTRKRVTVKVERKNDNGPVRLYVSGLSLQGVTMVPKTLPELADGEDTATFELVASPSASPGRMEMRVVASFGTVSRNSFFKVDVVGERTVEDVVRNAPFKKAPTAGPAVIPGPNPPAANQVVKAGKLTAESPFDAVRKGSRANAFPVFLKAGKSYAIDMTSEAFDSFLRIEDSNGAQLASDDNSGGNGNARIVFTPRVSSIHYLIGTSTDSGKLGDFTITVTPR